MTVRLFQSHLSHAAVGLIPFVVLERSLLQTKLCPMAGVMGSKVYGQLDAHRDECDSDQPCQQVY